MTLIKMKQGDLFEREDASRASAGEDRVLSLKFRKSPSNKVMFKLRSEWGKAPARSVSGRTFCVESPVRAETISKREREK